MSRVLNVALLIVCLTLSGCTIQDVLRATLGGRNSDEAYLNRVDARNGATIVPDR